MATYIVLAKFTQQGSEKVRDLPKLVEENRQRFTKLGAELKSWHLTMGTYDVVSVVEVPNDEAMAKLALTLASQGNVRTETLRAFSLEEFKKIAQSIS